MTLSLFQDNRIYTSKYNILTFLPINLFEQFQRVANAYFLFLLILQLIPEISSLTWFTTIVPLVLVISMTAVKDATDDYFRHKSDNQVNNRQSEVLINSKLQNEKWMNVKVGDIIKLENNQFVAADLLLLSSSEPHGLCYVETAELDGETNLKVRQALPVTSELGADISSLAKFDGIVICEAPNNKLEKFSGVLSWKDSKHTLSNQKIILRGCVLRNTRWCFGMVLFAGEVLDDLGQKKEITKKKEGVDFSGKSQPERTLHFRDHSLMESIELGDPKVHEFLRLLALCHTVMSEEDSAGQLVYQVQSPDEGALVTAARNFGFIFKSRTPETITVEELGTPVTYQLLAFLDFSNIRKRMSVIETAINIGYACNVLTDAMDAVFVVTGNTAVEVRDELRKAKEILFGQNTSFSSGHVVYESKQQLELDLGADEAVTGEYALVINGHSLAHALESDVENDLLELACMCKTVVCCRVTPLQKAQVVELVKKHRNAVTLAIGDGANDVSMIKSAHIGIGISGQEGLQAVLASDYALAQFRYLQRLLLVHGRWSYYRMCKFLCYFFYKNFAFTLVHFWFAFFCGFSAQDVSDQNSMDCPQLYEPGQLNLLFNKRRFFICVAHGIYTSLALFFIPYGSFYNLAGEDGQHIADYQSFAVTMATSLVIVVSVQIRRWQKAQRKERPIRNRRPQSRSSSSRRSGYAFAHQEGYGELITSGKNMRAESPAPTSGLEKMLYNNTSWIENLCKKTTDVVSFNHDKTAKL
ncbi:putative phospholipid-transporting ATPase IM [Cricetulus griseus]|uniref:P-type phospholipid transporter n=1 Tax=Cricetulus griseus TaxID=10029 RepID=G3H054_CRIGR|nr:putative phospholipid-transporting ATPase IM [Cricetulus griseus]